jgi:hypothetical protein
MTGERRYATPAAMRRALTDRLTTTARDSRWTLAHLQRQVAYDRLLERLYRHEEGWVLKGAAALLARRIGVRATIDIDLYRAVARDGSENELRTAGRIDIGDWFTFEVGPGRPAGDRGAARRLPVTARVGAAPWASFHVDLADSAAAMTGKPEGVPALVDLRMAELSQHGYRAYPLADHVADTVVAMYEVHGPTAMPSTRYRDLVDLVAIAQSASVPATLLGIAVRSESARRAIDMPPRIIVPDRGLWESGYAAEARRSLLSETTRLNDAIELVGALLDPVLDGTARGRWDPVMARWRQER